MILKGNFIWAPELGRLEVRERAFLVAEGERIVGIYDRLPPEYAGRPVTDWGEAVIIPSFNDLHIHAPQLINRGIGYDARLLDWLDTYTFPVEARYRDMEFARAVWKAFLNRLWAAGTLRFSAFATIHKQAAWELMELTERSGLRGLVGKVNMDRNAPEALREDIGASLADTEELICCSRAELKRVGFILTPRFVPSCTDELMQGLGQIQKEYHLPVQSHLSENPSEIAWVQELCPQSRFYGDAYRMFGLFGGADCPTIMAHCVHSSDAEIELMKQQGVFVAHCPASNTNLASGIAPVRRYLTEGIPMGLGSDVAGGTHTSIFRAMADAIQVSKLRWRLQDSSLAPLTAAEAFYLGTLGGGAFFGKVGSFLPEYEFDALVMDDSRYTPQGSRSIPERLERALYLSDDRDLEHKFAAGRQLF